ncbi:MAG TPA: hypothetical protein VKM55_15495 [Candidatus Lokiarchaeia archaeon]|nr:hypothetical protein [Candidatus Lokiarchaeia archaeon]
MQDLSGAPKKLKQKAVEESPIKRTGMAPDCTAWSCILLAVLYLSCNWCLDTAFLALRVSASSNKKAGQIHFVSK